MNQGNIIGEEFSQYTSDQIDHRQTINGLVGNSNIPINPKVLIYQNNRNAWIKMASGVGLTEQLPNLDYSPINLVPTPFKEYDYTPPKDEVVTSKQLPTPTGLQRLDKIIKDSNLTQPNIKNYSGTGLAKNFVLFNTISNLNFDNEKDKNFGGYTFRQGIDLNSINQNWLDVDSTYGLGGTSMGFQPTPGITEISIDCVNRGSIRKANVKLKAFNRFQFDIIEMLYLRLGYTMMLEWGWDKYISSVDKETKDPIIEDMGSTVIDDLWFVSDNTSQLSMLREIESKRSEYGGNYDGFFGKVSNFNWTFNPDGSYDISIDLITLGSVIESLKVNLPANFNFEFANKLSEEDKKKLENENLRKTSSLYKELGEDIITRILRQYIIDYDKGDKPNPLYRSIDGSTTTEEKFNTGSNYSSNKSNHTTSITDNTTDFFISFKDFIDLLQTNVIDLDKNNNYALDFETTPFSNYISVNYNQIPFTPSVCMHNIILSEEFLISNPKNNVNITRENNSLHEKLMGLYSDIPTNFINHKDGYIYGDLLNLYLNVDFISRIMGKNLDEKGNLSLYNLMTSLCEGLNDALGGLNNLEVIIKNDKVITIIDQNPIPGIKKITESSKVTPPQLEVFGYNNTKSNFLRDIKFETKIDNSLTTMISVGATGDGTSTKNYDATSFSKWNVGLTDRFSPDVINPSPTPIFQEEEIQRRKDARAWVKSNSSRITYRRRKKVTGLRVKENPKLDMGGGGIISSNYLYKGNDSQKMMDEWVEESVKNMKIRLAKELRNLEIKDNKTDNYKFLLHYLSGVNYTIHKSKLTQTGFINPEDKEIRHRNIKKGELYNSSFSNKVKAAFREYINFQSNEKFKNKNEASGNIGFIPIHFNITLEGISGVKIYNKLNIDTRFLPSNYQNSLDFLINKVNHKVSNNDWQTILGTMSTSNLEDKKPEGSPKGTPLGTLTPASFEYPAPIKKKINGEDITNGKVPEGYLVPLSTHFDRKPPLKTFEEEYKGSIQSDKGQIRLEKNACKAFANLLKHAKKDKIEFHINSAYRTYKDQIRIKWIYGENAATPGRSDHGFGLAIDFALVNNQKLHPTHKQYKWLKENASKYNIYRQPYSPKNKPESWEAWHWYYRI